MLSRFEKYCRKKTEAAVAAHLPGFVSAIVPDATPDGMVAIGNEWSRRLFDGPFYRTHAAQAGLPALSLVFVQSADRNTGADDPFTLGGGETDKHLIYEGLSRVDADAVLAGATTAAADALVFSVWHPELVELRTSLRRTRHPAQVVLTDRGDLPVHRALLYNEPTLRVVVLTNSPGAVVLARRLEARPWVEVIDVGQPVDVLRGLRALRDRGIDVVSSVGGRRTAEALLRAGAVADLYLTTSPQPGGEAGTALCSGRLPPHRPVLEKEGQGAERGIRFQHLRLD